MRVSSTVLSARDARALADFYERLLGWERVDDEPNWVKLRAPSGAGLSFQTEIEYRQPIWPARGEAQQMMAHLDIAVSELHAAVEYALALGATEPADQPQSNVTVMLDPAGHPFCLFQSTA